MARARRKRRTKATERYGKGTPEWVGRGDRGKWVARVSIPGQGRDRIELTHPDTDQPLTDKEGDRALAVKLTAEVSELARARAAEEQAQEQSARLTVQKFGEMWTSGKLYERHGDVNGLKPKKTAKDDEGRLKAHVYPLIGSKPVADVTEQDIEWTLAEATRRATRKRGKRWRSGTKFQVYQVMRRLFELARRPGRLREDNPVPDYLRPPKDKPKLYGYLYPSELLALLGCESIPVGRRVLYGLAVYTGLRLSSLYALTWDGIDFQHRTLTSLQSKTGLPQMFEIPQGLATMLAAWFEHCGRPDGSEPVVRGVEVRDNAEAETLRADLKAAAVDRAVLFSDAENVEAIRFHDLRATFVTWAMREGRGDGWISDRTGHLTAEMRMRYARQARTLADLDYEPFPDISDAVPELSNTLSNVARMADFRRQAEA